MRILIMKKKDEQVLCDELKHAKKHIQEYKKAVDESTIFSIGDTKGRILYANKQFLEVSGYSFEELVGKPHSVVRDPQMPKEVFAQMWKTIQNKRVWKGTITNRKKNGQLYYVEATIVPILDENGNITEYAGIRNDITKLVLKERELAELKDKQRSKDIQKALEINTEQMLESIPFASIIIDANTLLISHYNKLFEELFYDSFLSNVDEKSVYLSDLLVQNSEHVFEDEILTLLQRYELLMPHPRVAMKIDGNEREFYVGIKQLSDKVIVTLALMG